MKKLLFPMLLVLAGCSTVPSTSIWFNPRTKELRIKSPKNISIGGISILSSSNSFSMNVTNYTSTNDSAVLEVVTKAQAAEAQSAATVINNLANLAAQAVAKAP